MPKGSRKEMPLSSPYPALDRFNGVIWPNGHFGVSYRPRKGQTARDDERDQYDYDSRLRDNPIGLAVPAKSHSEAVKKRNTRGLKGITSFGQRMVENGAYLMERKYGKARLSFVTLTLPECSTEEGWRVSTHWPEIVRQFFQSLGRKLADAGLPKTYCSVTETQGERMEAEGHPALHMHFICVGATDPWEWKLKPEDFRDVWRRTLEGYLPGDRTWEATEQVKSIRKSVECYLGKYMTKGSDLDGTEVCPDTLFTLPKTWWNMSNGLRRAIKSFQIRDDALLAEVLEACKGTYSKKNFKFLRWYDREVGGSLRVFAFYGKLSRVANKDIQAIAKLGKLYQKDKTA